MGTTSTNKHLSVFLGNDGLTREEIETLAQEINLGSVMLDVHGVKIQLDSSTPQIENGGIRVDLYVDEDLFPTTTKDLVDSTQFYDVTGGIWLEETPYEIEHSTLFVKDLNNSHTASFPIKIS